MPAPALETASPPGGTEGPFREAGARARGAWSRALGWGALAVAPAALAVAQLGRIHPDEVYQALEPAWYRAHGYGVLAWEWQVGLRNWAVPGLLSWLLRLASALGVTHPVAYRAFTALPQVVLHGWMLLAAYRYCARRVPGAPAALATALVGFSGPVLVFAGRTLGESFSTAFTVIALEALDRGGANGRRAGLIAGGCLGLAVVTRYGSAVFVVVALGWLVATRRWRRLAFTWAGGGAIALLLGALDWATWGAPFHSIAAYLRFNLLSGEAAARFGSEPWSYYLPLLVRALPATVWLALALTAVRGGAGSAPLLPLLFGGGYVLAISATPHKEARFLYPALVLFTLAAAPRVAATVWALRTGEVRAAAAALCLAVGLLPAALYPPSDLRGDQFRAIVAATRPEEVRGLLIVNEGLWGAGGFFYIGKPLPWLTCDWPQDAAFRQAMADPRFNRAVTFEGRALAELQASGFQIIGQEGRETILAR